MEKDETLISIALAYRQGENACGVIRLKGQIGSTSEMAITGSLTPGLCIFRSCSCG
jgi:hypothetical protein